MMFKKQSPQRKPRMVRGVDVCGHPVGCACIYCQDETKSRTNDNIVTQIINAVVGGGGWSKKAAEQDVKDILAPIEAELQRVYQANSANHELYLEADDKRKGAEKLVAGLREEIERLKAQIESAKTPLMMDVIQELERQRNGWTAEIGLKFAAQYALTELRAKLAVAETYGEVCDKQITDLGAEAAALRERERELLDTFKELLRVAETTVSEAVDVAEYDAIIARAKTVIATPKQQEPKSLWLWPIEEIKSAMRQFQSAHPGKMPSEVERDRKIMLDNNLALG